MTITSNARRALTGLTALAVVMPTISPAARAQGAPGPIAAKTTGLERREGFLPMYLDAKTGKLLLELPRDSLRALLMVSQATGLGSNPIGIDRGASEGSDVVRFDRDGERVLVVLENWR